MSREPDAMHPTGEEWPEEAEDLFEELYESTLRNGQTWYLLPEGEEKLRLREITVRIMDLTGAQAMDIWGNINFACLLETSRPKGEA